MRQITILFLRAGAVLCSACSFHAYRQTENITPLSYQDAQLLILRNEGKLRRLVLLPIKHDYTDVLWIKWPDTDEKAIKRKVQLKVLDILINWKGYEIIPINADNYRGLERPGLSFEEMGQKCNLLADWAKQSTDNAEPPPEVGTDDFEYRAPIKCRRRAGGTRP